MDILFLIGRILFAALFLGSAYGHFTKTSAMTGYAQYKKLPLAKPSVLLSGLVFLLGGISIALGFYGVYGALAIAIVLVTISFIFHDFWTIEDAEAKQTEQLAFNKDMALAGAALVIAYAFNTPAVALVISK